MNKFQKIAFTAFIVLSISLAYWGYKALRSKKAPTLKAISLVPDNCTLLLTFNNFSEFTNSLQNKNLIWQEISELKVLREFDFALSRFDSIILNNDYLSELTEDNPVHFALYDSKSFLVCFNLKERDDETSVRDYLSKLFTGPFLYELKDGVICASNSAEILKTAFDQNRAKLINNSNFEKLSGETNYNGTSIYMNARQDFLPANSLSSITLKPENITVNGVANQDSSRFFGHSDAPLISSTELLGQIPLLCNEFEIFAIHPLLPNGSGWWKKINDDALFNAEKQFYDCVGSSLIVPVLPSGEKALIIQIQDTALFREIFPFLCDSSVQRFPMRKLKSGPDFFPSTFHFLPSFELNFILRFEDHVVFTKSSGDADVFINSQINQTSLLNNSDFAAYASKNFDLDFHYLSYRSINSMPVKNIPFSNLISEGEKEKLKNISHYSLSGNFQNNYFNFRLNLKYFQDNLSSEPNVLWTMNTDSTIITQPYSFVNHLTKAKEIVYQMSNKSLVLQSATGKTIWTKKLNEEVRSEIFTVDAFKNGKNQLLFNSDNYLHLIDRNGNYVQGYPVKLPAKATNKLSMFDYEKTRDYRLFIACADEKIYNYSIWGIKQEGFKTFATMAEVILPLKYCKVGLSDYLVTADVKGRIYAFSRKGEGRIDFKNKLLENTKAFEMECGNSLAATSLLYYDEKNSLINKISLSDKKDVYKTSESKNTPAQLYRDFDKNSVTDIILVNETGIEVIDAGGLKIAEQKFAGEIIPKSASFFQNDVRTIVSALDSEQNTLIILSTELKSEKKLKASKLPLITDLFNDGKLYAVIIDGKSIRCIKL